MAEQNPSPADVAQRELEEKERKAREDAEQAQLPYKWTQTIRDVDVSAPIPANIKGRDMDVVLTKTKIKVAIKGQEPIVEVCNYRVSSAILTYLYHPHSLFSGRFPPSHPGR